jgi:hypothetical protein
LYVTLMVCGKVTAFSNEISRVTSWADNYPVTQDPAVLIAFFIKMLSLFTTISRFCVTGLPLCSQVTGSTNLLCKSNGISMKEAGNYILKIMFWVNILYKFQSCTAKGLKTM